MIAIAVLAVLMFGARVLYLGKQYRVAAELHAATEAVYASRAEQARIRRERAVRQAALASTPAQARSWDHTAAVSEAAARELRELAAREARLKQKYRHAAARPWRAVTPE